MIPGLKYRYSDFSIWFTAITACLASYFYIWQTAEPVNFIVGDARYYYIYLQNTFIDPALINYDWLDPASGVVITHHPVGFSILVLPFFLLGLVTANLFHYPLDGISAPFQASISIAAIFYCVVGLIYLKKLFGLNHISDKVTALVIALLFFGSTLFHYTLAEGSMSHVYSFSLLTIFLYHSCKFVRTNQNKNLIFAAVILGLILLLRPNNILIVFTLFFWFRSKEQCFTFFKELVKTKAFYYAILIVLLLAGVQLLTWLWKEDTLFVNRYSSYGFYWTRPHLMELLFGFEAGLFVYAPLCFLFLFGWIPVFKENKFLFFSSVIFLSLLIYIFASYSAYTYFDGLGIRVLVDYYSIFALIGAKLFMYASQYKLIFNTAATLSLFLVVVNLIYCYQGENNILLRSGMNYQKWKYVFLKTGKDYEYALGGCSDLQPFSKKAPGISLASTLPFEQPFDYSGNEYGPTVRFDSLGFDSRRIQLKMKIRRKEKTTNSSHDALVCAMIQNKNNPKQNKYFQFKLNEMPSATCCDDAEYSYSSVMEGKFTPSDNLSVYLWNIKKQDFTIDEFSVQVYNYNYE